MINLGAYSHQAKAKKIKEPAVAFGLMLKYDICLIKMSHSLLE